MPRSGRFASVVGVLIGLAVSPSEAQGPSIVIVAPDSLAWTSTPIAPTNKIAWVVGAAQTVGKAYVLFARYPAGGRSMPHTHPDERVVTVLSGTFYVGSGPTFDESDAREVPAGGVIVVPANAVHWGFARQGEVTIQEVGIGPTATVPWPKKAER
jgi:quercetin dioxygenase-like cupin family protein